MVTRLQCGVCKEASVYQNQSEVMSDPGCGGGIGPKGKSGRGIYEERTGTRSATGELVLAGRRGVGNVYS